MIKIELTDQQYEALSGKKLADVVSLVNVVEKLTTEKPQLAAFLECFLSNAPIEVIYNGGSNAGALRRIIPQSIKADGSFRAFCVESDTAKSFRLDKVELK
jgi:predicted DNA-binding transcriptional regulator YafY